MTLNVSSYCVFGHEFTINGECKYCGTKLITNNKLKITCSSVGHQWENGICKICHSLTINHGDWVRVVCCDYNVGKVYESKPKQVKGVRISLLVGASINRNKYELQVKFTEKLSAQWVSYDALIKTEKPLDSGVRLWYNWFARRKQYLCEWLNQKKER